MRERKRERESGPKEEVCVRECETHRSSDVRKRERENVLNLKDHFRPFHPKTCLLFFFKFDLKNDIRILCFRVNVFAS